MKRLLIGAVLGMSLAVASVSCANDDSGTFNAAQKAAIDKAVQDYIANHPAEIIKSLQQYQMDQQKQQINKAQAQAMKGLATNYKSVLNGPTAGNANGAVTVVEYYDYQCGHCLSMNPTIDSMLQKDSNVKMVYKDFPIFGGVSDVAAKAGLAANMQGKYAELHNAIMGYELEKKERVTAAQIDTLAKQAGIDVDKMKSDMDSSTVSDQLAETKKVGAQLGVMATPFFIVAPSDYSGSGDDAKVTILPGAVPLEALQAAIKKAS